VGAQVELKLGDPNDTITSGFFYAVDFPPLNSGQGSPETGGAQYRWNIINETPYSVEVGDWLQIEPGNMQGPTGQGLRALIDLDPNAYWDNGTNTVQGSDFGTSPRVVKLALFDPQATPPSGRNHVVVSKLAAFFIEGSGHQGTVIGRFMGQTTTGSPCAGTPSLLTSLHLTQ